MWRPRQRLARATYNIVSLKQLISASLLNDSQRRSVPTRCTTELRDLGEAYRESAARCKEKIAAPSATD
jgi:hypothetical protein